MLGSAGATLASPGLTRWQTATFAVGLPALFAYVLWRGWQERRNLSAAEQINRELLRRADRPYKPHGPPTPTYVPPFAMVAALMLRMAIFIPMTGLLTLAIREQPLSPSKAILFGLPIAAGAAIGIIATSRRHNSKTIDLPPTSQQARPAPPPQTALAITPKAISGGKAGRKYSQASSPKARNPPKQAGFA